MGYTVLRSIKVQHNPLFDGFGVVRVNSMVSCYAWYHLVHWSAMADRSRASKLCSGS